MSRHSLCVHQLWWLSLCQTVGHNPEKYKTTCLPLSMGTRSRSKDRYYAGGQGNQMCVHLTSPPLKNLLLNFGFVYFWHFNLFSGPRPACSSLWETGILLLYTSPAQAYYSNNSDIQRGLDSLYQALHKHIINNNSGLTRKILQSKQTRQTVGFSWGEWQRDKPA